MDQSRPVGLDCDCYFIWPNRLIFSEAAAKASSYSSLAHLNLGTTYHTLNRFSDAEPPYVKALELNLQGKVARNNLVFLEKKGSRGDEIASTKIIGPWCALSIIFYGVRHFSKPL